MRFIPYLIFVIIASSCLTNKNLLLIEHINPKEECLNLIDSLISADVDTIISYASACSGCVQGSVSTYFISWIKDGQSYITKYNELTDYNTIQSVHLPYDFININYDEIINDSIIEPENSIMHGRYHKVYFKFRENEFEYTIDEFEKEINQTNFKIIVIDKIRSALFDIPIWAWTPLSFKTEKRKKYSAQQ